MTPDASVFAFMSRSSTFQPEENQSFFASDVWVRDTTAQADLSVTKTDSPDPVTARSDVTYTVTVTNSGPATATGVTLVDQLPEAVFVSATASQGSCARSGKGRRDGTRTCDLGSLAPGATATVTIVLTILPRRHDRQHGQRAGERAGRRQDRQHGDGGDERPPTLTRHWTSRAARVSSPARRATSSTSRTGRSGAGSRTTGLRRRYELHTFHGTTHTAPSQWASPS
jgi:uncharacterized repeat protein (TIGR01451 family)